MNIIIICATILISSGIIAISMYKSIEKLSLSLEKVNILIQSNKGNTVSHYPAEIIEKQDNASNNYEKNITESIMEMQGKVFDKPIMTSGKIQSSSRDDDIKDISEQLKGINQNGR